MSVPCYGKEALTQLMPDHLPLSGCAGPCHGKNTTPIRLNRDVWSSCLCHRSGSAASIFLEIFS